MFIQVDTVNTTSAVISKDHIKEAVDRQFKRSSTSTDTGIIVFQVQY